MRLVFDIETNPIDFSKGNAPAQATDVWCVVVMELDFPYGTYEWVGSEEIMKKAIPFLERADELIGHNIIEFDIPILERLFGLRISGKVTDTLVLSRLLYPDRPGGHSLGAWGERLRFPKGEFNDFQGYSTDMLEYCRQDVRVNAAVFGALERELKSGDWGRAVQLEHDIARIIAEQERTGFWFNKQQAEELINGWSSAIASSDADVLDSVGYRIVPGRTVNKPFKINGEHSAACLKASEESLIPLHWIVGPFSSVVYAKPDLNSKQQQKELLLELGWQPENLTPSGQPKLDESILKIGSIGEALHTRNVLSHRLSQVQGLLDITDENSRVHGGANPCGTPTGRMRHSRIVNIPRVTSPYGNEIRSLFGVPNGKYLVGYDASSLELRMLAHYLGNEEYNDRVCSDDKSNDAHTLAARVAGSTNRDLGKTINYALIYGAGDLKLGAIIGGTKADGARLRKNLYDEIPGLGDLVARVQRAARRGYLVGIDGRKLWVRGEHKALNTLIQAGGAVFMKTATVRLHQLAEGLETAKKVVDIHDEAQWECGEEEVPLLSKLIHTSFNLAEQDLELFCPQEAEVKVGKNWAETH